jgi:heptosyltransferase-2
MRVLFVKLGAIGDALMARGLPVELKRLHPQARLTWMAGRSLAPLVALFPGVDRVLAVDDAGLLAGSPPRQALALLGAWGRLGPGRWDQVLVGHADPRYGWMALPAWGPRRSFQAGQLPLAGRYHGDEYVRLLTGEAAPGAERPPLDPLRVMLQPALRRRLGRPGPRRLLLFAGGARNLLRDDGLRRWPLEHYASLARMAARRGWRVILGGGPGDGWVRPAFQGQRLVDLIGACDLPQTLALCSAVDRVLTHDSGPLHLAMAAGAKVTALFGPTQPHEKVDPRAGATVLWGGEAMACRPCYDGRGYADCPDPACLRSVSPAAALQALER